jgi:two-component system sensor histidine kinase YcbA
MRRQESSYAAQVTFASFIFAASITAAKNKRNRPFCFLNGELMKTTTAKESRLHLILTVSMTVILGQFYFNPFGTQFRITLGVIALTFLLIYFRDISIIKTSLITGLSIFIFRSTLFIASGGNPIVAISIYFPAMLFYMVFGLCLSVFEVRKRMSRPFLLFIILSFSDIVSNIAEVSIRREIHTFILPTLMANIFTTGFVRGFVSLILYWTFHTIKEMALRDEKEREENNLFVLSAKIIGERYYLKKSMGDIESTMEASHDIYLRIKESPLGRENPEISNKLIGLSNNIHEIKKDYRRIVSGLEGIVPDLKTKEIMSVEEVYHIIFDTNKRFHKLTDKNIILKGKCNTELETKYYLSLTSIVNNLLNNAIEASEINGKIILDIIEIEESLSIRVKDDGCGIDDQDMDLIFKSGFSTKYDKRTGKMSTGVGLTHVKTLVEEIFEGTIDMESEKGRGTEFIISLPLVRFIRP